MLIKRFFDIVLAAAALILLSPVMLVASLMIRLDSFGPVLFKQDRVGYKGKNFTVYKFRTMVEDAEAVGPVITAKDDPRITQVGVLLRWLKIDELPQFINVLKGDMSFVGPRPEATKIVEAYSEIERKVLDVKPGIFGPSQNLNRDEESKLTETEDVEKYYIKNILPGKLRADLSYVKDINPLKDFNLLLGGMSAVLFSSIKLRYIFESRRRLLFLLIDILACLLTYQFAFVLRFEGNIPDAERDFLFSMLGVVALIRAPCFIYFGLYQTLWQYLGIQELISIIKAVTVSTLLLPIIPFVMQVDFQPRSILIIDWVLLIMTLGGFRILFKITAEHLKKPHLAARKNVLIIGADDTGEQLIREFIKRPSLGYRAIGLIDDDPKKVGVRIHGVKVLGKISQLPQAVRVKKVDEVIIALSEISGGDIKEILNKCRILNLPCRIVPQASTLMTPQTLPLRLRSVEVSDLLGRELVHADLDSIQTFFQNKRVLVTGAGGSIGSELAKILVQSHLREIVLVDHSENNLYEIETDLQERQSESVVHSYLRDVTNHREMKKIFERHKPEVIFHAAAYKHVPLVEVNYAEGILNNILGTKTMADLALEYGVERFILISTDKAIRPRSVMGATKRITELYTQSLKSRKTRFLTVRFGNVFNSKGSVVPLFKKQIERGGPITVTDPNANRYFMDVSEAVFLILQVTILGTDSEIFILDMGKSIKIIDLARNLVQLMGLSPESIPIKYIGLRPGEKLEENLELDGEKAIPTSHRKIKIWKSKKNSITVISKAIDELLELVQQGVSREDIVHKLMEMVPDYRPGKF